MEKCTKCGSTHISSGSWTPGRCMNCGACESYHQGPWYYDNTIQPSTAEIRKKSGYKPKPKRKKVKTVKMVETCGKCKSTNISGGSWVPDRCMNCGAIETIGDIWYYDATAQPTIASIRRKSGYKPPIKKKSVIKKSIEAPIGKGLEILKVLMYSVMALASVALIGVFAGLGDDLFGGVGAFMGICLGCCTVVFVWRKFNA